MKSISRRLIFGSALDFVRGSTPLPVKEAVWRLIDWMRVKYESLTGTYKCSVCGNRLWRFDPLAVDSVSHGFPYTTDDAETCNALNYSCPRCGASDRDRIYALYLRQIFAEVSANDSLNIIDFAPSIGLSRFILKSSRKSGRISYRTADLFMEGVDDQVDIMDMPLYADSSFDLFICSHVLEHIADDRKALKELYRILKPGGHGILVVPIVLAATEIDEDPSVTDPEERWRRFGQDDHVRLYSKRGFLERVLEAGFAVRELGKDYFGKASFERAAITSESVLYVVEK